MSMQIRIDATSNIAPPITAPTLLIRSAAVWRRCILWRRRLQSERLADRVVPLPGALGTATLGPACQDRALDQLLVGVHLLRLDRHDGGLGELAHGAGLHAAVAVVGLGGGGLD